MGRRMIHRIWIKQISKDALPIASRIKHLIEICFTEKTNIDIMNNTENIHV